MSIKQWLKHLWVYLLNFPLPKEEAHLQIGIAGHDEWHCPICGATGIDKWEEEGEEE